jgi:ATP-dependent helicase HepA
MGAECTFVVTIGQGAGNIAKLVDATGNFGVIEYFDSPSGPRLETIRVPIKELRQIELATQTRVFRLDPLSGVWSIGRVDGGLVSGKALGKSEDHYHVRFPNGRDERVPISQLFVRRASPVEDPTEYLASMITDTPFFFDGRSRIVRHLADQRRLFGGLTGLASSAIELLEHQVSVVRKVLSDPIQRYLLADEVGLGKTIEAGILIRQHLLDYPDGADVLVVVPDHLVLQWRKELRTKFYIYVEDERVQVVPLSTMHSPETGAEQLSLLVIDEAHVSAEWAFSADPKLSAGFCKIRDFAKLSQRVLLLSGTPVLYREKEFLAMLHLLDPEGYRLSEIDSFRKRINERQTVAEALADLSDEANGMFVEEAIDRIDSAFANDARATQLSAQVRDKLWDDVANPARVKALRDLRSHIREAYKLDRRILRTRRVDPSLRDRLPVRTGATIVDCPDPARVESAAFLEAWRLNIDDLAQPADSSKQLFAEFVSSALGHPRHLARRIEQRIATLDAVHRQKEEGAVSRSAAFEGERKLLEDWNARLSFRLDDGDGRTQGLIEWLRRSAAPRKHILFITDRDIADIVALTIRSGQTPFEVIRYNCKAAELRAFEQAALSAVLVCDRRAEEGLNLQRAGAVIIHYDLPLDPLRIEQRIGRVDRIEGRGHVSNVILAAKTAYEMAWTECVVEGVGVFNRSIAPLQFLLNIEVTTLTTQLLSEGSSAFLETSRRLRDPLVGTLAELKRIDAQDAIDSAEVAAERETGFFRRLVEADERIAEVGKRNLDAWLVKRLGFDYQALDADIGRYGRLRVWILIAASNVRDRIGKRVFENEDYSGRRARPGLGSSRFVCCSRVIDVVGLVFDIIP